MEALIIDATIPIPAALTDGTASFQPVSSPSQVPCHQDFTYSQIPRHSEASQIPYHPDATHNQTLNQYLYSCIQVQQRSLPHSPTPDPSFCSHSSRPLKGRQQTLSEVLNGVWSHLKTLFVARQQLELVGIMRRTVSNMAKGLGQVSHALRELITVSFHCVVSRRCSAWALQVARSLHAHLPTAWHSHTTKSVELKILTGGLLAPHAKRNGNSEIQCSCAEAALPSTLIGPITRALKSGLSAHK
jgi:hypothetical protein